MTPGHMAVLAMALVLASSGAVLAGGPAGRAPSLAGGLAIGIAFLAIAAVWLAPIAGWVSFWPVLAIGAAAALARWRAHRETTTQRPASGSPEPPAGASLHPVRLALICVPLALLAAERAVGTPGWDGWAIWEFKARAIHAERRLDTTLVVDHERYGFSHPDYPPGLPVLLAATYDLAGGPAEEATALWGALVLAALVLRLADRPLLALWVLAAPPFVRIARMGQADLLVALMALILVEGLVRPRPSLVALATAGAVLVKNEGVALWAGAVAALAWQVASAPAGARALGPRLAAALAAPLAYLPWFLVRIDLGLTTDLHAVGSTGPAELAARLATTLARLAAELTAFPSGGLGTLGILILLGLLAAVLGSRPGAPVAAWIALGVAVAVDVGAYAATRQDLPWLLETSFRRVLAQLAPAAALVALVSIEGWSPRARGA